MLCDAAVMPMLQAVYFTLNSDVAFGHVLAAG